MPCHGRKHSKAQIRAMFAKGETKIAKKWAKKKKY